MAPRRRPEVRTRLSPMSIVLRLEGAALLLIGVLGYALTYDGWVLLVVLFLAPDIAFVGYLAGPWWGALAYNALHTSTLPIVLAAYGLVMPTPLAVSIAGIWLAHIGLDRLVGYGLKYASGFKATHLHRV